MRWEYAGIHSFSDLDVRVTLHLLSITDHTGEFIQCWLQMYLQQCQCDEISSSKCTNNQHLRRTLRTN